MSEGKDNNPATTPTAVLTALRNKLLTLIPESTPALGDCKITFC
jgi:hypothetical protein